MIRLLALALLVAFPAMGQTVKVSSGDHADFTRIVVEYAEPVEWQVGRTADGYELRLPDGPRTYDLSKVFDLIGKNRLAAIWADPEQGALHLSIACACFAIPFEFRPGIVVIDIRSGSPPKGSSFELPLDGGTATELAARPAIRPLKRPISTPLPADLALPRPIYDWTAMILDSGQPEDPPSVAVQEVGQLDLQPLRQSLIEQLSRGASQGIVDMARPAAPSDGADSGGNPSVEVRLGDAPNLVVRQRGEAGAPMTAKGATCIPDEKLDVPAWAQDTPISGQIGPIMSALTGEFDVPVPQAIQNAVQFYLHLGFGAEARAILRAFPTEQKDAAIWQSMAHILDNEPDAAPAFAGMAACDTAAALWAVLADPEVPALGQVEKAAILRTFSALPGHLRRQLGPILVDRFLAMQDFATAISLRDAVLRGLSEPGPEIDLMLAAIERAGGSPGASEALLEGVATTSGPDTAKALMTLVVQRAELGQEVSFQQVQSLEVFAKEREGTADEAEFDHALTLAYAASGDFGSAFGKVDTDPESAPFLWKILAISAPDSALLDYATLSDRQPPPYVAKGSASLIATRMLDLGLSDQAARWLTLSDAPGPLLAARVRLAEGQPEDALTLLGDDQSPSAVSLRATALRDMGDDRALADLFAAAGMTEEQWATISRMQDWPALASSGPEGWKQAAQSLVGSAPEPTEPASQDPAAAPPDGPLAQSQALLANSQQTRDAIMTLLNSVDPPNFLTQ